MSTHADQTQDDKSQSVAEESAKQEGTSKFSGNAIDHRPESVAQSNIQRLANSSPSAKHAAQLVSIAQNRTSISNQYAQNAGSGLSSAPAPSNSQLQLSSNVSKPMDTRGLGLHETAAQGVQGSGGLLPFAGIIQRSFGGHDISHIRAYTGSNAQTASENIGAAAYATGNKIAFASTTPDLHTSAHEAAHVIQQQAGVQLSGGVGAVGDKYERHADAVADRVVQRKSAEDLLTNFTGMSPGAPRLRMPSATDSRNVHDIQMKTVGMVPQTPGNWRHYTNNAGLGTGIGPFTAGQRTFVHNANVVAAGVGAPVLAKGAYPLSDSTKNALLTKALTSAMAVQIDHIIPQAHGGSNAYENARVLSQGENNGNLPLGLGRPARANQRMRAFQNITVKNAGGAPGWLPAKTVHNAGTNLTLASIKGILRYQGVAPLPVGYANITNGHIAAITAAVNGTNNNVTIS